MEQGIIVGCDRVQEWLLPWWWKHYSAHNFYPVVFADFGMSEMALAWCKERGEIIDLSTFSTASFVKKPVDPEILNKWEARYGDAIWNERYAWFKKPFACLQSPFTRSVWLDLDCQVRGSLNPLFFCLGIGAEISMRRESKQIQDLHHSLGFLLPGEVNYNSGVICFSKQSAIIEQWVSESVLNNEQFLGDQQALSRAVFLHKPTMLDLSDGYNWSMAEGDNPDATIQHYHGGFLKLEIVKSITNSSEQDVSLPLFFDPAFH